MALGATPRRIEISNLLGAVLASGATTLVILLMARVYGFSPSPEHLNPLPAPQPNAMAAVLRGVLGTGGAPWFLYGVGAVFALVSTMIGVSGLALALGMYLPMELNSPLVLGAFIGWLLQRTTKDAKLAKARGEKGTLIASGFIAGGALMGVFSALLRFFEESYQTQLIPTFLQGWMSGLAGGLGWTPEVLANWLGLFMFVALGTGVYLDARREKAE